MDTGTAPGRITGETMSSRVADHPQPGADGGVLGAIGDARVVPVVTIDDAGDSADLVRALVEGRLPVVEITLRTPSAIEAIRRAVTEVPIAIIGAGSATSAAATVTAIDAGACFIVSPGVDEGVIRTAQDRNVPVIPGIATATELMRATTLGVDVVKLFPAEVVGGVGMIAALSAVWPDVRFMPTGGITPTNLGAYLALRQVLAVGGSWMVPRSAVVSQDWAAITSAAAAAHELTAAVS